MFPYWQNSFVCDHGYWSGRSSSISKTYSKMGRWALAKCQQHSSWFNLLQIQYLNSRDLNFSISYPLCAVFREGSSIISHSNFCSFLNLLLNKTNDQNNLFIFLIHEAWNHSIWKIQKESPTLHSWYKLFSSSNPGNFLLAKYYDFTRT